MRGQNNDGTSGEQNVQSYKLRELVDRRGEGRDFTPPYPLNFMPGRKADL